MLAEMDARLTLVDHVRARKVEADEREHPGQRDDREHDRDREPDRIAARVSPAIVTGSKRQEDGNRDTEGWHDVDPLRVEIGLVDDSGNDDHCAEGD